MNKKIIKKILKSKHEQFCASIKNEDVRKLVESNSIITGGSIVSLLIGEPIKDFDYYFTDYETAKKVTEYYINEFVTLNPNQKIKPVIDLATEKRVRIRIQSSGITSEESDNGYKYFENLPHEEAEKYIDEITKCLEDGVAKEERKDKPDFRPVFLSDNAITLSNQIQLVIRFYGNPEEIHKNYDFTHCTNYWTSKDNVLTLRPEALESILAKELFYQGSLYPICSVIRTRKFLKRGWYINAGQYLKMCFQISELNLKDINVLQEQLTGVDAAYFMEIIDYCRNRKEKEPDFEVTMPYLCKIVDKVFG